MLVTALNEILGYDTAAKAAKYAYDNNLSLKEACLQLNIVTTEEFEKIVNPSEMVYSKVSRVKL
jgi:fumarate hydratase class II